MAAEEHLQEPGVFGEISVNLIEEKQFILDPYLFALSGNNIQQYCTMLSLMEFQNSKSEMFVITEDGVETPLSLVQVVEEFEIGPSLYQGDGAMQTVQSDPLQQENPAPKVQLQYNFMHKSDGGVLQGKLSGFSELQQGTKLQTKEYEFMSAVNNLDLSSEPLQVHPALKEPVGDLGAVNPQETGPQQPTARCFTAAQPNEWIASQRSEQSIIQDAAGLNPPPGNYSGEEHHNNHDVEESSIHTGEKSQLCRKSGESSDEHTSMSFSVQPNAHCSITYQLAPSGERSCECPSDEHTFSCSTSVIGHQIILTNEWERLFSRLSLSPSHVNGAVKKPFKCPDCGKGYFHKSSIIRHHQKCHGKENPSLNSGQKRSFSLGSGHHPHQKAYLEEKPLQCPDTEMRVVKGNAKNPSATPSSVSGLSSAPGSKPQKRRTVSKEKPFHCSVCGKAFTVKSTLVRHQLLHEPEKPFKCLHCNKGYIQKCHLKRHVERNHIIHSLSNEQLFSSTRQ